MTGVLLAAVAFVAAFAAVWEWSALMERLAPRDPPPARSPVS